MNNSNSNEVLQYLIENGIIDLGNVENDMKKQKLQKILLGHPYSIKQGKNGRWTTYVYDENYPKNRRQIAKSSEEKLHEALYNHYCGLDESKPQNEMTLETLYPRWLEFKSLHTDAPTYITRIVNEWKKHYEGTDIVKVPVTKLTKLMLDEWAHRLIKNNNMSKKQYYNCTVIMNQALDYAVDLEVIEKNPFKAVKIDGKRMFRHERKKASETQIYTRSEEAQLKRMAWDDFEKRVKVHQLSPLAVLFQFETGVRIGELVALRYEDVNGRYLHVQRMWRRDAKEIVEHTKGTYGDREVILTSEALRIIESARKRQEELGVSTDGYIFSITDEPVSYYAVSDLYRKYCNKMGIEVKSSHKSRKTVISSMIDANMNINTIREMAGHADERTTYNNYCFDRSTEDERIEQMERALA